MRSEEVVLSFSFLFLWLSICFEICYGRDTLKVNQKITQDSEGNLFSSNATFELGFFSPGEESGEKRYLGIWYHGLEPQTVVWVANRDHPVADSSGVFRIAEDGNLVVEDASSKTHWSSKLEANSSANKTLKLLDSGNLVLIQDDSETTYLWQSFQNPTDTFLPGMKMDATLSLTSWRDSADPAPGNFTFKMTQKAEKQRFVVQYHSHIYWAPYELGTEAASQKVFDLLHNTTWNSTTYKYSNKTVFVSKPYMYNKSRLVMSYSGEIVFLKWDEKPLQWNKKWFGPEDKCDIYDYCGSFGICNRDNLRCKCLPGFSSVQGLHSDRESESQGCERKSKPCNSTNEDVWFLNLTNIKVGNSDQEIYTQTEAECQSMCINMCPEPQCQAYSFNTSTYGDRSSYSCYIWTEPLTSLVENNPRGRDLSILVKKSDIAPTAKSCEPCGTYAIPYPLSTGPNCGDPMYHNFNCNKSSGIVSFMMPGGKSYPVTWIDEATRMFSIQTDYSYFCGSKNQNNTPKPPFRLADSKCSKNVGMVNISWEAAPEPPCGKLIDCENWLHSTCTETSEGDHRCHCNSHYKWDTSIMMCAQEKHSTIPKTTLVIFTIMVILGCIIAFLIVWRKRKAHKLDSADEASSRIQESLHESERHVKGLIGLGSLEENDIEGIEVPCYTFASILSATDNFSDSNKLGRGGYGPVYKGTFYGGHDIAVKRLSNVSTQGLQEFKNEVILIAKLQHRNLVRLRGYCIKGDEKILLYEYMPNKSLDSFIFDRTRTLLLDWPMRFKIIVGIARGMLYLHQDSRLRVIHRDLKTSNILLDEEMNPKISDFGLAKIFGGKETEASTERVVGTYGYMAPEYALDGLFSIKSDVFSFGVILLEILSGKRNTGFYESNQISSLLGYAWKLWTENRLLDLMDSCIGETCNQNQFIKCAIIGLLCIQDEPIDRPNMSNVLFMLDRDTTTMPLPIPTQPTFFVNKLLSEITHVLRRFVLAMRSEGVVLPFSFLLLWLPLWLEICLGGDTLKAKQNITQDSKGNLVSSNDTFELGFFSPGGESGGKYLGIWYHGLEPQTVVWVANRDHPVADSSGVFRIAEDGNLVVEHASSKTHWSSELGPSSSTNRTLKLLDSGNLVLVEDHSETTYLWQSFQNPTDTFLPGMKMDATLSLTSWRDSANPAPGDFTFKLDPSGTLVVLKQSQLYWTESLDGSDTKIYDFLSLMNTSWTRNSSFLMFQQKPHHINKKSRLIMNSNGEIQFMKWDEDDRQWDKRWWEPDGACDVYGNCGSFGICKENNLIPKYCKCLPGFRPRDEKSPGEGCIRKSTSCSDTNVTFLNLTNIKVGGSDEQIHSVTEAECESLCRNRSISKCSQTQCQAYSYSYSYSSERELDGDGYYNSTCEIWTGNLSTRVGGGRNLSVLVKRSDIEATAKSCEPCGANEIPYPLSTGPNCGDPTYNNFSCNESTGDVSFRMPGGKSYLVTWIDEDTRMFYIETDDSYSCGSRNLNNTLKSPFSVVADSECSIKDGVIKMSWEAAPEPPCKKPTDCENWLHSTCTGTSKGDRRCHCNPHYSWNNSIMICAKEKHSTDSLAITFVIFTIMVILGCIIAFLIVWRKRKAHKLDSADEASSRIQESLHESERHVKGLIGLGSLEENDIEGIEVPCYTFASILSATDNFSDSNKLGKGGYGPVYKGTFYGGHDIAVKRLSNVSTQGLQEFKNEVILIAKLQHRNLVRLRGYCIKGDEKILLYEYMPNKSLDSFIFDRTRTLLLDWPMRFKIIVGIARGMLYLHQDSRLRVIHRDLKTSNILLDEEMNPKISDFGLAKIFGEKETEASTERVVGTYGYMAPEYALDGLFSIKSDVFSFGVILLEILSGKRNTGFYESNQISSLLGYAWKLWTENRLLDLMDSCIGETCNQNQFIKCAIIGLLCIQDEPIDRPTMSNVLFMLDRDTTTMPLPIPTQPTFFVNKRFSSSASSSSKPEIGLQFDTSYQQGR
ncbi:uncharacterized protein LOC114184726 [Vigna unguiculata]|uniref:uncharacterized protein LOC114184726 n=1 Tax=Vigna unguiculata TaxID=3917 RepID=UPI0010161056|nr:uncharacterized protein LOC114184726 [Vigna unguiculata]